MSEKVTINWKTGDAVNDRHIGRYRRCLYELIAELSGIDENKDVLKKYCASLLDDFKVGLEFPQDFDQSVLPKELQ